MEPHPTPLADQLAGLRAAAAPSGADCGMLPAALHAVIAAILARIFAGLERVFLLWQAGLLPTPAARHISPPSRPSEPRPRQLSPRRAGKRHAARKHAGVAVLPRTIAAVPARTSAVIQTPGVAATAAITQSQRPRSARAPPPV